MKKFFILVLSFVSLATVLNAARTSNRKTSSSRSGNNSSVVKSYSLPTQDECNVDIDYCFNRYCFDKKTLSEGVYSKCGAEPASKILINIETCLETRSVIKELDLKSGCKDYSYNRVVNLLSNKDVIETGLKKNSNECQKATKALQAAKQCYALMISSDGSYSLDLYDKLDKLCGFEVSGDSYMLNRFFQAGDYGQSNLQAISDLEATGQNTVKRENWRQVVDATLAGYTEIAELACGEEDYKLTKVNDYALDSRDNSAMIALKAQATEMGKQTANRIVNSWFRETDCVNAPLPVGGLYWDYEKGRSPDCKIVCKEGYAIGKNSSECVKIENKTSSPIFMGFNIGNDFVKENSLKKSEPVEQQVIISVSTSGGNGSNSSYVPTGSSTCSKQLPKYAKSLSTKQEICKVFFPQCTSESLGSRMYYENTGNYFCIGKHKGTFDNWVELTVLGIKKVFTDYDDPSDLFGNNYNKYLSEYLFKNCIKYCGKADSNPKVEQKVGSSSEVEEEVVSTGEGCGCEDIPEVPTTFSDYNRMSQWEKFATKCDLSACDGGRSIGLSDSIKGLLKAVTNTGTGNMAYGPSITNLRQVTTQVKECLCKNNEKQKFDFTSNDYCSLFKAKKYKKENQGYFKQLLKKYEETEKDKDNYCPVLNLKFHVYRWGALDRTDDNLKPFLKCVCNGKKLDSELKMCNNQLLWYYSYVKDCEDKFSLDELSKKCTTNTKDGVIVEFDNWFCADTWILFDKFSEKESTYTGKGGRGGGGGASGSW